MAIRHLLLLTVEQAVMLVQTHAVQLLILDIMMPKMNGLQAATQIRRLTNAPI